MRAPHPNEPASRRQQNDPNRPPADGLPGNLVRQEVGLRVCPASENSNGILILMPWASTLEFGFGAGFLKACTFCPDGQTSQAYEVLESQTLLHFIHRRCSTREHTRC